MSYPQRPDPTSPKRRHRRNSSYQSSRSRRSHDIETGGYPSPSRAPISPTRRRRRDSFRDGLPSPSVVDDQGSFMDPRAHSPDLDRKRSLVRPERNRIDPEHPNYHYRQHAQRLPVYPSTTGNDPVMEGQDDAQIPYTDGPDAATYDDIDTTADGTGFTDEPRAKGKDSGIKTSTKKTTKAIRPQRKLTRQTARARQEEKRRQQELEKIRPPSLWNVYCGIVTFWCPDLVLKCFGMPARAQRRAWREKMGLISLILQACTFVGFLTFGFTRTVCHNTGVRLKINHVDSGYMIFHGDAYNLADSEHPAADGIPSDSNVLNDLPHKYGGQDGSFLFQNVNGACKGLITTTANSTIPTSDDGNDLAWYFP